MRGSTAHCEEFVAVMGASGAVRARRSMGVAREQVQVFRVFASPTLDPRRCLAVFLAPASTEWVGCGDAEVRWSGDELDVEMTSDGILFRPCSQRDKDQWWYWTDEWQAGEQQIVEDRAAGRRGPVFASGDEFLAALREGAATDGAGDSSSR